MKPQTFHESNCCGLRKFTFPYQKEKLAKTKTLQKALQKLCDNDEDNNSSSDESYVIPSSQPRKYGNGSSNSIYANNNKKNFKRKHEECENTRGNLVKNLNMPHCTSKCYKKSYKENFNDCVNQLKSSKCRQTQNFNSSNYYSSGEDSYDSTASLAESKKRFLKSYDTSALNETNNKDKSLSHGQIRNGKSNSDDQSIKEKSSTTVEKIRNSKDNESTCNNQIEERCSIKDTSAHKTMSQKVKNLEYVNQGTCASNPVCRLLHSSDRNNHTKSPNFKLYVIDALREIKQIFETFEMHIGHIEYKYQTEKNIPNKDTGDIMFILNCFISKFKEELNKQQDSLTKFYRLWQRQYKRKNGVLKEVNKQYKNMKKTRSECSYISDSCSDEEHPLQTYRKTPLKVKVTSLKTMKVLKTDVSCQQVSDHNSENEPVMETNNVGPIAMNDPIENNEQARNIPSPSLLDEQLCIIESLRSNQLPDFNIDEVINHQEAESLQTIPTRFSSPLGPISNEATPRKRRKRNQNRDSDVSSTCSTIVLPRRLDKSAEKLNKFGNQQTMNSKENVVSPSDSQDTVLVERTQDIKKQGFALSNDKVDAALMESDSSDTSILCGFKRHVSYFYSPSSSSSCVNELNTQKDKLTTLNDNKGNPQTGKRRMFCNVDISDSDSEFLSVPRVNSTSRHISDSDTETTPNLHPKRIRNEVYLRPHSSIDKKLRMNCRVLIEKLK